MANSGDGNSASDSREATTQDLSLFPSLSFSEVEEYAKKSSGCENTAKAYKFFAEPGYLHDIKGGTPAGAALRALVGNFLVVSSHLAVSFAPFEFLAMKGRLFLLFVYFVGCLRMVVKPNCQETCNEPLGLADRRINDYQLQAGSAYNNDYDTFGPHRARLNLTTWAPGYRAASASSSNWLMIDLEEEMVITGLATQGYGDTKIKEWVVSFIMTYVKGDDRPLFKDMYGNSKSFIANKDSNTIRYSEVPVPVMTSSIVLVPSETFNNFALRMELYGCRPGYYFSIWLMFADHYFTLDHTDPNNEEYKMWKEDVSGRVTGYLEGFPGFLSAEVDKLSPHRSSLGATLLTAEVNIFCLKASARNVGARLLATIVKQPMVFDVGFADIIYPLGCKCALPRITVFLNKTLEDAKVLFTTQELTVRANVDRGNCTSQHVTFSWEISKATFQLREFGTFESQGDFAGVVSVLRTRVSHFGESYLYIRYVAKGLDQKVVAYDYGYVRVVRQPHIVIGPKVAFKGNGSVILSASVLYDMDGYQGVREVHLSWLCRRMKGNIASGPGAIRRGCYGNNTGKLANGKSFLRVNVDEMDSNQTYVFESVITKDKFISRAIHELTVMPPYVISLRCIMNCARKVSTRNRMIIKSVCEGPFCHNVHNYSWVLYKSVSSGPRQLWEEVPDLETMVLTDLSSGNIVFSEKQNRLERDSKYKLTVTAFLSDRIFEQGEMVFVTNSPPHSLFGRAGCFAFPVEGRVLQTVFAITCLDWHDKNLPLAYQLSLHSSQGVVIIAKGPSPRFKTMLPSGDPSDQYRVSLEVQISDSLGDSTAVTLTVKVKPLDEAETSKVVNRAVYGPNSTINQFLRRSDVTKAALISYFSLTALDGADLPTKDKDVVKDVVLEQLVSVEPRTFEEVTPVTAVVNSGTQKRRNMSSSSLGHALSLLKSSTARVKQESRVGQRFDMLYQVGEGLLKGMSNVLDVFTVNEAIKSKPSRTSKRKGEKVGQVEPVSGEKRQLIEESIELLDTLGSILMSSKVEGEKEPTVFQTDWVVMVLDRQTLPELAGKTLNGGRNGSTVIIPSVEVMREFPSLSAVSLDAQMFTFKSNPFTWASTSRNVTSAVLDFTLKANGSSLDIRGLKEPFQLFIPIIKTNAGQVSHPNQHLFVQPSEAGENMRYHKITIPSESDVAIVEVKPLRNVSLEIYVGVGTRPTVESFAYKTSLPNLFSCTNYSLHDDNFNCSARSLYTFYLSSSQTGNTGEHIIGILLRNNSSPKKAANNGTTKLESQFPCRSASGRVKRSCIGVKDPPTTPPPTPKIIVPLYYRNSDVNYTMSVSISSCLYWSEEKQSWTSDGCKVGPMTSPDRIHCLCTHLSLFGGDFFVAPNPLDFDKIWFTPREPKDFVVLTVVFCLYGLFFIGLVFARRADIKDKQKVVGNFFCDSEDQEGCIYEVYIQTGMWRGYGTTANVGIRIFGEEGCSGLMPLTDSSLHRNVFTRGSVNNFSLYLPYNLGRLVKIQIWHDNFGKSPSWFLQRVVITDPPTNSKWYFFANQWLALEKGSGRICLELRAVEQKERASFKHLFFSRASRSLGDDHLWVSLFSRPPHSTFTRCQRLSCCLSFLFTSMITNAMFYQFSVKLTDTFKLGPLEFSWTQVKIGIQSALMVVPINVLIVLVFRNVKFDNSSDDYALARGSRNTRSRRLSRFLFYLVWTICILACLVSSVFTVFYSLMWGADVANQWLTSITVSLVEDVLFIQPIKVLVIAMFLSLIIKALPENETVNGASVYIKNDIQCRSPEGYDLKKSKEYGNKVFEMFKTVREIASFLTFIILLMVVCYGSRDSQRYLVTESVQKIFRNFNQVLDPESFWNWSRQTLIPGLYHTTWYNGKAFEYEDGFISSRGLFLVGMPRLRQIRIQPVQRCPVHSYTSLGNDPFHRCLPPYSSSNEEKTPFNKPKWIPITNSTEITSQNVLSELCPKPWRYQSPSSLRTLFYEGHVAVYDGGGYVADLGYNERSALEVINGLQSNDWIDDLTVAVFVEFSLHEPSSGLFSFAKYLYERHRMGSALTTNSVRTLATYPSSSRPSRTFQEICQLLFVIYVAIFFFIEVLTIFQQKWLYFTHVWNWIRNLQMLTSACAIVMFFVKAKFASDFVRRVRTNPYETSSPDYIILWFDIDNYLLAIVSFLLTFRFLRLVRFNRHISQMARTLKRSAKSLASFAVIFVTTLLAYALMGLLAFGVDIASFSSFTRSLHTVMQMSVGGKVNFPEVRLQDKTLSPLFMSTFVVWMVLLLVNTFVAILVDYYKVEREAHVTMAEALLGRFIYSYFFEKTKQLLNKVRSNAKKKFNKLCDESSKHFYGRHVLNANSASSHDTLPLTSTPQVAMTRRGACNRSETTESFYSFECFDSSQENSSDAVISKHRSVNCFRHCDTLLAAQYWKNSSSSDNSTSRMQSVVERSPLDDNFVPEDIETRRHSACLASIDLLLSIDDFNISHVKTYLSCVALELKKIDSKSRAENECN